MDFLIYLYVIAVWLITSMAVCVAADKKNLSGVSWFLLALVASPLFAAILLCSYDVQKEGICPACKEPVNRGATVCPHCHTMIIDPDLKTE